MQRSLVALAVDDRTRSLISRVEGRFDPDRRIQSGEIDVLRVTSNANEMHPSERFCRCCEKPLARRIAWLEFDQRDNTFHDHGDVPTEHSQGWFPFGLTCARKVKAQADRPHTRQER